MLSSSVYVPGSLNLDVFHMIHVINWMALIMYIQCVYCEVGSVFLNIMSSEPCVGHPCFHSNLATFSSWRNFQKILLKFPLFIFVMLT
jgi:hypothetical protein